MAATIPSQVEKIAVLGAGSRGQGIALLAATSEISVVLYDIDAAALGRAERAVRADIEQHVMSTQGSLSAAHAAVERISCTAQLAEAVIHADIVIEAIPEQMPAKVALFSEVGRHTPVEVILATTTPALPVTEIASATRFPERVVGMHFFSPPQTVKLVEVVRSQWTDETVVHLCKQFAGALGREVVVVNDFPGFATTRLELALSLEAMRMAQEGVASPQEIDRAMEGAYGYPTGPLRQADLSGLDRCLAMAEYLHQQLGSEQFRPPLILRRMVRSGTLGRKTGQGFYRW